MFKQRLISTLVLVPCVLGMLFYAPSMLWIGLMAAVILACGFEWLQLIPLENTIQECVFMLILILAMTWIHSVMSYWVIVGFMLWGGIIFAELTFPKSKTYWGYSSFVALFALILLPLVFQSLILIYQKNHGKTLFLYLFFIVWAADIGAYLVGNLCGKHKLIPKVSPGKSWEGAFGGFILAILIAYAGFLYFKPENTAAWFSLAVIMIVMSIAGDLFISMLKRRQNLKDTGSLIPGHGGFLDRLDSLIAVSPVLYYGLKGYFPEL